MRAAWRTPEADRLLRCYFTDRASMVTASDVFDWVDATLGRAEGMRGRSGGELRGSASDRRARKHWLLATFGDGQTCPCSGCGVMLTYATLTVDRIVPGRLGGRYVHDNIRPACRPCNCSAGARGDQLSAGDLAF